MRRRRAQDTAEFLERNGYAHFSPHYITLSCPAGREDSVFCRDQCVNRGRYCEQDPDADLSAGYSGRDVLLQNLRQLCVFEWANGTAAPRRPWIWRAPAPARRGGTPRR